jgi:hypothetical protein
MDYRTAFNDPTHSDLQVIVGDDKTPFYLHKFPLIAKSRMFAELAAARRAAGGPGAEGPVVLESFPGSSRSFEELARFCYGFDVYLDTDNVAYLYAGCRFLGMPDLEKKTELFLVNYVLRDAQKAAVVLAAATGIVYQSESVMIDLVGRCINAVAARFGALPELCALPPDCFACIVRSARSMEAAKETLEAAVVRYLHGKLSDGGKALALSPSAFLDVVGAAGRFDSMRHCDEVYAPLELLLAQASEDDAADVCSRLQELGFWTCLPHSSIERAFHCKRVPVRFTAEALMAENRHLLRLNDELSSHIESLTRAMLDGRKEAR